MRFAMPLIPRCVGCAPDEVNVAYGLYECARQPAANTVTLNELPPELALLARAIQDQPPEVQNLFPYALVMLLVENGRAEVLEQSPSKEGEHLTVRIASGEEFSIVRPNSIDLRQLQDLLTLVRHVLEEEEGKG